MHQHIGLCGSHRVGKTTLAKEFVKKHPEFEYLDVGVSQIIRSLGYDSRTDYDMDTRIEIQQAVLGATAAKYAACSKPFISDRTPYDMVGYMIADVQKENCTLEQSEKVMQFIQECGEISDLYFRHMILVQPGIPITDDLKSAPAIPSYMEHLNLIIAGFASTLGINAVNLMPRSLVDLQERVQWVSSLIENTHKKGNDCVGCSFDNRLAP